MMDKEKRHEQLALLVWTTTLVATAGSLYYSEIRQFIPCEYCWYQRILMYPNLVIYTIYLLKKERATLYPAVVLSGLGIVLSTYHYLIQKVPKLQEVGEGCGIVPCNGIYVNYFGFITIPLMALLAFIIIFVGTILLVRTGEEKL